MLYEIKHRWNGSVLFSLECGSLERCVEAAVDAEVLLRYANLRYANLRGVNLCGADLSDANLCGADLSDANLCGANLRYANLSDANLRGVNLRGVNLGGVNLSEANLRGVNLGGVNLSDANLRAFRDDIWAVVSSAPTEAKAVRDALLTGKINGSCYEGDCCCLVGTLGKARGCEYDAIPGLTPDSSRFAEVWFFGIKTGDTPETDPMCKQAYEWVDEWIRNMESAFAGEKNGE